MLPASSRVNKWLNNKEETTCRRAKVRKAWEKCKRVNGLSYK
jgi:hypothetical protein